MMQTITRGYQLLEMFPQILYGGDYNPEQWSPEVWQEDARLMQEAGVNRVSLGAELPRLTALRSSRVRSEVAIIFDWENWWALEGGDKPANDFEFLSRVTAIYSEFYRRNISVDFAHPEGDLSSYRLVVAPHLYLVSDRAAQNIEQYVANGGALCMTFFSGIADSNEHIRLGGYPAPFRKTLGMWVEEYAAHGDSDTNRVETEDGKQFACGFWSEVIHLEGAEKIAWYAGDYVAGGPAITRHTYGKGSGYYLSTALDPEGISWLLERLCRETGVQRIGDLPQGVEVTRRSDGTHTWLFMLNFSGEAARVDLPAQNPRGRDLITGTEVEKEIRLEPNGVAVIELGS